MVKSGVHPTADFIRLTWATSVRVVIKAGPLPSCHRLQQFSFPGGSPDLSMSTMYENLSYYATIWLNLFLKVFARLQWHHLLQERNRRLKWVLPLLPKLSILFQHPSQTLHPLSGHRLSKDVFAPENYIVSCTF